jgi:NTE family protein
VAGGRANKKLARFERIALVLSGGAALGAYQAGACAALEESGVRPNWIAGTAIGAVNAVIIAGNPPHERVRRLRRFWDELSRLASRDRPGASLRAVWRRWRLHLPPERAEPAASVTELRRLIGEAVDFERVNSGALRVVLGAVDLTTGAEILFDNDRHVLGFEHVLAGTPPVGLPPVEIGQQLYGGSAVTVSALDDARPEDTLCFVIDGYDPAPGGGGSSRTAREIRAMRRIHDLRRRMALLGECLPPGMRDELDIRRCLAEASEATMTILHLVHEGNVVGLAEKTTDFSAAALMRLWKAGESDIAASLAHPLWLAPPPRIAGAVVHEMRGGVAASPR